MFSTSGLAARVSDIKAHYVVVVVQKQQLTHECISISQIREQICFMGNEIHRDAPTDYRGDQIIDR